MTRLACARGTVSKHRQHHHQQMAVGAEEASADGDGSSGVLHFEAGRHTIVSQPTTTAVRLRYTMRVPLGMSLDASDVHLPDAGHSPVVKQSGGPITCIGW